MKPISLQMQAFGPFAGAESIMFSDLGESPLFLINGPTGSGKTTVLDAICYALYGSTTGNERDARDMRCQQSDPALLTEVVFEFRLGGSAYQITRSPDQSRPRLRGEGVTSHKTRADLYKLGPDGSKESGELLVERKVSEANEYIKSITGLNAEQFRQVMILPQGQFRKLLMANSKDKQEIFESLFQTSIYSKIEDRLKKDSKEIRDSVGSLQSVIGHILESVDAESDKDLEGKIKSVSSDLTIKKKEKDKAEKSLKSAETVLNDAEKLNNDFETLKQAKTAEAELKGQAVQVGSDKAQAKKAHAAEKLLPILARAAEAKSTLKSTEEEVSKATLTLAGAEELFVIADGGNNNENGDSRREERAAAGEMVHKLISYSGKAEELVQAKNALAIAQKDQKAGKTKQVTCDQGLAEHLEGEVNIQQCIKVLGKDISGAEGIDLEVHRLNETLSARTRLSTLQASLLEAGERLVTAKEHLLVAETERDKAGKTLKRLRQTWHQCQATILARELEEGEPCPVCGSAEHPHPAAGSSEMVTEEQLEVATAELESKTQLMIASRDKVSACQQQVEGLTSDITQSRADLGEQAEKSEEELTEKLGDASALLDKLTTDRANLVIAQQALQNHSEKSIQLRGLAEDAAGFLADAKNRTGNAQTLFDLSESALPEPYREVGRLEQELKTATEQLDSLNKALKEAQKKFQEANEKRSGAIAALKQLKLNLTNSEEKVFSTKSDWAQALLSSVFDTVEEVNLAAMPEAELSEQDEKNSNYDNALLMANTARKTLENRLKGKSLADQPKIEAAETTARLERDKALEIWSTIDRNMNSLNNAKNELVAKQVEMAVLDAEYSVVGTLADTACGLKGPRVSLQRYILGVLLDDVLVQSTQRLMKMSDGRYELRRQLDATGGNRASGLDLEVYDDYSGESRSVSTLSGGESFMAALSLALGLSDVVQAQTGGIQLDTLFVDEGFGTLDSEALELAVSTLMELQQAGRMVGIISHVAELKEQMDIRIDLTKSNRGGSRLKVVSPMKG